MSTLQIDLDLIQRINKRQKIRNVGLTVSLVGLLLEIVLIIYLLITSNIEQEATFFPLSVIFFSISLWFVLYYAVFQIIDMRDMNESNFIPIKKRFFQKAKKRSRNILIIFLIMFIVSALIFIPFNQGSTTQKMMNTGSILYFNSGNDFGMKYVKSFGLEGNGVVIIYQNGSSIPIYRVDVNGVVSLNQTLPSGSYYLVVESGNVDVHIYYQFSYYPLILAVSGSIIGVIIVVVTNILLSRRDKLVR